MGHRVKTTEVAMSNTARYAVASCLLLSLCVWLGAAPPSPSKTPAPDPQYVRKMIPTKVAGTYRGGTLVELRLRNRNAYVIKPTGTVDSARRWVWIFPFWLGINDG